MNKPQTILSSGIVLAVVLGLGAAMGARPQAPAGPGNATPTRKRPACGVPKQAAACGIGAGVIQGKAAAKAQTTCPVMGGKINKKFYADYKGKRVYFCCPDCIQAFKKNPDKYVKKLERAGVILAKAQTTCPVMGGKINKKFYADYKGKRVYFCCPDCIQAFRKNPDKYVNKLEKSGITLDPAPKPTR